MKPYKSIFTEDFENPEDITFYVTHSGITLKPFDKGDYRLYPGAGKLSNGLGPFTGYFKLNGMEAYLLVAKDIDDECNEIVVESEQNGTNTWYKNCSLKALPKMSEEMTENELYTLGFEYYA